MIESFRKFLNTTAGRVFSIIAVVVIVAIAIWSARGAFSNPEAADVNSKYFICADTGKSFRHTVVAGEHDPIDSPFTGKKTAYPAELCYWTAAGKPRTDPYPVLLNTYKKISGPTFCPDCGRLVVGNNPDASGPTPPTKAEYDADPSKWYGWGSNRR